MSLRLEMLQVARLAPTILGEEATSLVRDFVLRRQGEDGGFSDRDGVSDLYYTSFAIDCLTALQVPLPQDALSSYLEARLEDPGSLDFVHLCCLARCASALESGPGAAALAPVFARIEEFRAPDGGYRQDDESETGSTYAAFLAYGALSDHGREPPEPDGVSRSVRALETGHGAWANDVALPVPNIPATAAAVTLYRNFGLAIPPETGPWILSCQHPAGGFVPFPGAPLPDLLSTAVALHALDGIQFPFGEIQDSLLDYVDTLWTAEGGFHGSWEDDELDIEYTYYGLLALGHLAL